MTLAPYSELILAGLTIGALALWWRGPQTRWLEPIKSLWPSWRFFDRLGYCFEIEVKVVNEAQFEPLFNPLNPELCQFFYNPKGNLRHALVSGLSYFAENPDHPKWQNWLKRVIQETHPEPDQIESFQVKAIDQNKQTSQVIYRYDYFD